MPKRSKVRCDCTNCNGRMVDQRTRRRHYQLMANRASEEPSSPIIDLTQEILPTMDLIQGNADDSRHNFMNEYPEDTNIDPILPRRRVRNTTRFAAFPISGIGHDDSDISSGSGDDVSEDEGDESEGDESESDEGEMNKFSRITRVLNLLYLKNKMKMMHRRQTINIYGF